MITGGYLILSPENEGIVLSLDCCFWIEVEAIWSVSSNIFESKTKININCSQLEKSNNYILSDQILSRKDGDCGDLIDNSVLFFSKIFKNISCSV